MKWPISDASIVEIATLQVHAARLFGGDTFLMDGIRLKLKREYQMNYRHVLEMHKLLKSKFDGQIRLDEFHRLYIKNLIDYQDMVALQQLDND